MWERLKLFHGIAADFLPFGSVRKLLPNKPLIHPQVPAREGAPRRGLSAVKPEKLAASAAEIHSDAVLYGNLFTQSDTIIQSLLLSGQQLHLYAGPFPEPLE